MYNQPIIWYGKYVTLTADRPRKKRSDALSPDEKKRRDRESWARSRARTGNWSSRAYNLAVQDAARWVRDTHPAVWEDFYEARTREQLERAGRTREIQECTHPSIAEIPTEKHALICTVCRSLLGDTTPGAPPDGYKRAPRGQRFTANNGETVYVRVEES